jgi:hypothetical protein
VFLGYSPDHKGYRCYDLISRRVLISRHVVFDESDFPFSSTSTPSPDAFLESMFSDPVVQPPIYIFPFPAGPSGTPAPTPSVAQRLSLLMHHPRFWCPLSHPIRAWCLRPRHVRPRHLLSRPGSLSPRHTRLRYLLLHPPPSWCPAAPCAAPPPHAHYAELVQVPPQSGGFSGFYPGGARGLCASSTLCLRASFDGSSFTTVTRAVSVASTCAHTASASAAEWSRLCTTCWSSIGILVTPIPW